METLLLLAVLGFVLYALFQNNTRRGIEAVRAYVFLDGLRLGATVDEANQAASYDVANGPTELILWTRQFVGERYGNKQLAMIADAYRHGMTPKLPSWQRKFVSMS